MSDPEATTPDQPANDVDAQNDVVEEAVVEETVGDGTAEGATIVAHAWAEDAAEPASATSEPAPASAPIPEVDPDLAAFEEAERSFPGTFGAGATGALPGEDAPVTADATDVDAVVAGARQNLDAVEADVAGLASEEALAASYPAEDARTEAEPSEVVATGYDETRALPLDDGETVVAPVIPAVAPQPIFVQAPEPPRQLGNRGVIAGIGLLASVVFAVLYLAATLGLGALDGTVDFAFVAGAVTTPLTTWAFWTPVAVFFIAFWLLGAIINRGRWGFWVIFGVLVGVASWGGYLLGQLFEAPFWAVTATQASDLLAASALSPLAIAAGIIGRELTVWFGAWAAKSGARRTELNAVAQEEYERTIEAGPTIIR